MAAKKSALGRGLGALIDDGTKDIKVQEGTVAEIEVSRIQANPYQPRDKFDEDALNELAASIKEIGIIQPITVRKLDDVNFQLIAGERRLRASKIAGLDKIPAYVRAANDQGMMEMALIENIQREDLDSIQVALSYQHLIDEHKLTQDNLSDRVGKKRSTVSNYLRLLKLPAKIQLGLRDNTISMGHARAIINIKDEETQLSVFEQILKTDLSVRRVEDLVRELKESKSKKKKDKTALDDKYEALTGHLSNFFGSNVDFKRDDKGKGKIVIPFGSDGDLERIIGIFDKLNT